MLLRLFAAFSLLTLCVGSLAAQPAALQPVEVQGDLPFEQLDQWGVKCYEYLESRQVRERASAGVVWSFRPKRLAIVLTSTWVEDGKIHILDDWPIRDEFHRLHERIIASYPGGSVISVDRIHVDTSLHFILGERTGDVMNYTIDGAPGSEPMYPDTLSLATFMRLVTILPMTAGTFGERDWFDIPQMELQESKLPVICHGPETIYFRGLQQDTTRYSHGGYTAWVRNHDRVLLKLEMPGRRYLELLKDGNCCDGNRLRDFVDEVRGNLDDDPALAPGVPTPATPAAPVNPANPLPF